MILAWMWAHCPNAKYGGPYCSIYASVHQSMHMNWWGKGLLLLARLHPLWRMLWSLLQKQFIIRIAIFISCTTNEQMCLIMSKIPKCVLEFEICHQSKSLHDEHPHKITLKAKSISTFLRVFLRIDFGNSHMDLAILYKRLNLMDVRFDYFFNTAKASCIKQNIQTLHTHERINSHETIPREHKTNMVTSMHLWHPKMPL